MRGATPHSTQISSWSGAELSTRTVVPFPLHKKKSDGELWFLVEEISLMEQILKITAFCNFYCVYW